MTDQTGLTVRQEPDAAALTVKQQLNQAQAAVAAAEQRVNEAQRDLDSAQARRLEAEAASPEAAGVLYSDPGAWRCAMDAVAFAWSVERREAEALETARSALDEARAALEAARRRNLLAHRSAILGKLGRRGSEVARLLVQLQQADAELGARAVHTREVAARWVGVLGCELKKAGLASGLPQDPGGRDWNGFLAWSERLMTDHLALTPRRRAVGEPWQARIGADEEV